MLTKRIWLQHLLILCSSALSGEMKANSSSRGRIFRVQNVAPSPKKKQNGGPVRPNTLARTQWKK